MDTLLIVAIIVIALAVGAQAVALIGMYLMSRRIGGKVETLMEDSRRLQAPLESITSNLKTVSDDLTETGRITRDRVLETVDVARDTVMKPLREYSAISAAVSAGVRTFFSGKPGDTKDKDRPAA